MVLRNNRVPGPPPTITGLTNSQIKQDANRYIESAESAGRACNYRNQPLAYGGTHRIRGGEGAAMRIHELKARSLAPCAPRANSRSPENPDGVGPPVSCPPVCVTAPVGTDVRLVSLPVLSCSRLFPSLSFSLVSSHTPLFIIRLISATESWARRETGGTEKTEAKYW